MDSSSAATASSLPAAAAPAPTTPAADSPSADTTGQLPAAYLAPPCPSFLAPHVISATAAEPPIAVRLVASPSGMTCLVWSYDDCVRLRRKWRVAVSPIGNCPQKIATNGKLAATPVVVEDDVLWMGAHLNWWRITDSSSGAVVSPWTVLDNNARRTSNPQVLLLHRAVFADLWAKGYRMTNGIKFGVDYLAYRADPSMCHAAFMVLVMPLGADGSATIAPLDLVTRSRVATTALKICVLAYVDTRPGGQDAVSFAAFRRMGPGHVSFQPMSADFVTVGASRWTLADQQLAGTGEEED